MTTKVNAITKVIADIIGFILMTIAMVILVPFIVTTLAILVAVVLPMMTIVYAIKDKVSISSLYIALLCELLESLKDWCNYLVKVIKR